MVKRVADVSDNELINIRVNDGVIDAVVKNGDQNE